MTIYYREMCLHIFIPTLFDAIVIVKVTLLEPLHFLNLA
jgi:hypothetical protein